MDTRLHFFLHLPRTAGTTLNAIIRDNFAPHEIFSVYSAEEYHRHREIRPEALEGVRVIQGHLFLETYRPPRIYSRDVSVFTFLRDPVERLVSEYIFLKSWPQNHMYAYLNENNIGFGDYVESMEPRLVYRGKNFMTRFFSGEDFDVQSYPEQALRAAMHNLEHVFDFVGIQERFDESLLLLAEHLGLRSLCHEKRNVLAPESRMTPDADALALARERNAADLVLYRFACDLFDRRVRERGETFARKVREFASLNARYQKMCRLITAELAGQQDGAILLPK